MNQSGIAAIDNTIQVTNSWLQELMDLLDWTDRERAYRALRVVLHALRDRLKVEEAVNLGAQLPMLVRGFYYEGWHPEGKPVKDRKKKDLLAHVARAFPEDPNVDAERVARAVFQVLANHVLPAEIENVKHSLPADIRAMWP